MISRSIHSATTRLVRLGLTATDYLDAQRQGFASVREVVDFDAGSFATVDPATVLWTSCVLIGIERNAAHEAALFENEYRQNDVLRVAGIARQRVPAGRMSAIEPEIRGKSLRYQMLRQLGAVDELRCALVDQGECWGSFEIYRTEASGPFTDEDVTNAAMLSKPLAQLIRTALLRQAASVPESVNEPPGVLLLNARGEVESMSPTCASWLEDISVDETVPASIRSLAFRVFESNQAAMSMVVPRRSGGWLRLHAIPIGSDGRQSVSIIVEPARPAILPETVARVYGLTPRECEVITWMARGLSSKEIAGQLGISVFTVNDHAKAIFQKVGVQSRQQLVATLFFDHCLPLRERDATPGPYGWFLNDD